MCLSGRRRRDARSPGRGGRAAEDGPRSAGSGCCGRVRPRRRAATAQGTADHRGQDGSTRAPVFPESPYPLLCRGIRGGATGVGRPRPMKSVRAAGGESPGSRVEDHFSPAAPLRSMSLLIGRHWVHQRECGRYRGRGCDGARRLSVCRRVEWRCGEMMRLRLPAQREPSVSPGPNAPSPYPERHGNAAATRAGGPPIRRPGPSAAITAAERQIPLVPGPGRHAAEFAHRCGAPRGPKSRVHQSIPAYGTATGRVRGRVRLERPAGRGPEAVRPEGLLPRMSVRTSVRTCVRPGQPN